MNTRRITDFVWSKKFQLKMKDPANQLNYLQWSCTSIQMEHCRDMKAEPLRLYTRRQMFRFPDSCNNRATSHVTIFVATHCTAVMYDSQKGGNICVPHTALFCAYGACAAFAVVHFCDHTVPFWIRPNERQELRHANVILNWDSSAVRSRT